MIGPHGRQLGRDLDENPSFIDWDPQVGRRSLIAVGSNAVLRRASCAVLAIGKRTG